MARSIRTVLNEGNPNKVADAMNALPAGEALALLPRTFKGVTASDILVLPEAAKCAAVLGAFGEGTVPGAKTPLATGLAPATLECAPNAAGDILFNAATDEITEAEVQYLAYEGTIFEDLVVVGAPVANQGVLLGGRAASVILEAEALTGGSTGVKTPELRSATPGAGEAAITEDGLSVEFAGADAVTSARIRYIATPGVGDAAGPVSTELDVVDKGF